MRYSLVRFVLVCWASLPALAQNAVAAEQAFAQMQAALGGAASIQAIRSLAFTAAERKLLPGKEIKTELKVEWLLPDKFYKQEKTEAQKNAVVTLTQVLNGTQVWLARQINAPGTGEDTVANVRGQQTMTPPQIANSTLGMKDMVSGTSTVRTSAPGAASTTERTILGMPMPKPVGGKDTDNDLHTMVEGTRAAKEQGAAPTNQRPGVENPSVQAELERELRAEVQSLRFVLLPTHAPLLQFTHFEVIKTAEGKAIEAIDVTGPEDYQARLFVDQATHLPVMLSYRALRNPHAGYVVTTNAADLQEVAVQLFFSDYQKVNQVLLPFRLVKAVNGIQVEEWKIEKYKPNAEVKARKFEKK